MKYRTFILFGAPGSGKGTQGKTLGTIPRFYHCPCGDVFRSIDMLVLDGIPRNVNQAKIMRELIDVEKVLHLACPNRETLFGRLKKRALKDNRLDDANEQVIQKRLDIYEKESKPVLNHYPKECIAVIDAMQPPAKVLFDILASVNGIKNERAPARAAAAAAV